MHPNQIANHQQSKKKQPKVDKNSTVRKSGGQVSLKKNKNDYEEDNIEDHIRQSKGPHFLLVGGTTSGNQSSVIQDPVTSAKSTTRGGIFAEDPQIKALRDSRALNETQQPTRISNDFSIGSNPKTLNPATQTRLNWIIQQQENKMIGQMSPHIIDQAFSQKPYDLSVLRDEYQKMVSSRFGVPKPLNMQDYLERQEMIKKMNKEKRARWQSLNNIEASDQKKKTTIMPQILKDRQESRKELGALVEEKFQQMYRPEFSKVSIPSQNGNKIGNQKGMKQILNPIRTQGQIMCFYQPHQQNYTPHIQILNKPFTHQKNHPINIIIRQINLFCNQLTFATRVPTTLPGTQQKQSSQLDLHLIQTLARLFNVDLPKNQLTNQNFLKSRAFILSVKESMLKRLFMSINETNGGLIDYSQARLAFQSSGGGYKVYVGSGNNAQMIVQQIYKEQRWWWNVQVQWGVAGSQVEYEESEEADEDEMQARQNEKQNANSAVEDFKEQNLIWTQWKKYSLFNQLKQPTQTPSTASSEEKSKDRQDLTLQDWDNFLQGGDISKARVNPRYVSSIDVRLYAKLENNFHLSNKCSLFYNMRRYYEALGRDPFEVIPLTFHIKKGCTNDDQEYQAFLNKFKDFENQKSINTISSPKASKTELNQKSGQKMIRIRHQKNKMSQQQGQKTFFQHNQINGQGIATQVLFDDESLEPGSLSKRKLKFGDNVFSSPKITSQYSKMHSFVEPPHGRGNTQIMPILDHSPRGTNGCFHKELDENDEQNSALKNLRALRTISGLHRKEESQTKLPVIPSAQGINGFQNKLKASEEAEDEQKSEQKIHNIWIIKPGENTNRGNGIKVCSSLNEIKEILNANMYEYHKRTFILQKYIERPQLYQNRKFDIRCYGMLTSVNGHLKGFFYDTDQFSREGGGYLRTSSREYNVAPGKLKNQFIHLTNDAVQKKADDYGKHEIGNKISFREYQQYLNDKFPDLGIDFQRDIFSSQIKRIITDTFRATCLKIDPYKRHHSFEIFGYDFMLDEDFKVQLIEVNTNPCIETAQCPILQRIITDMVDSGFRIAVDPLFPPPSYSKRMNQSLPFTHWELVFDSDIDGPEVERLLNPEKTNQTACSNLKVIKE